MTVRVVIAPVVASNTSFTSTERSGKRPFFWSTLVAPGDIDDVDLLCALALVAATATLTLTTNASAIVGVL